MAVEQVAAPEPGGPPFLVRPGTALAFTYCNWEKKVAERRALVLATEWGSTSWHPTPGWLLRAKDLDKGEIRLFAMGDMSGVQCIPHPAVAVVATTGLVDNDREELRQRARTALAEAPANDYMTGHRAAWEEILRVLDAQDAIFAEVAAMPADIGPEGKTDAADVRALSVALQSMMGPSAATNAVLKAAAASLLALRAEVESYQRHCQDEYVTGFEAGSREAEERLQDAKPQPPARTP